MQTNVGGAHKTHRLASTSGRTKGPPRRWKSESFASASTGYGKKLVRNKNKHKHHPASSKTRTKVR